MKPDCYSCVNRRSIAGDCHSLCVKPSSDRGRAALIVMATGSYGTMVIANPHGIRNGWFCWPFNFDPTWLESCEYY